MKYLFLLLFLSGCVISQPVAEQPTGNMNEMSDPAVLDYFRYQQHEMYYKLHDTATFQTQIYKVIFREDKVIYVGDLNDDLTAKFEMFWSSDGRYYALTSVPTVDGPQRTSEVVTEEAFQRYAKFVKERVMKYTLPKQGTPNTTN